MMAAFKAQCDRKCACCDTALPRGTEIVSDVNHVFCDARCRALTAIREEAARHKHPPRWDHE